MIVKEGIRKARKTVEYAVSMSWGPLLMFQYTPYLLFMYSSSFLKTISVGKRVGEVCEYVSLCCGDDATRKKSME